MATKDPSGSSVKKDSAKEMLQKMKEIKAQYNNRSKNTETSKNIENKINEARQIAETRQLSEYMEGFQPLLDTLKTAPPIQCSQWLDYYLQNNYKRAAEILDIGFNLRHCL